MKQATNFRLDETVLKTIAVLSQDLNTSKTDIIERSVLQFARNHSKPKNALLQFAGSLAEDDAEQLLASIRNDKTSKDIEFSL